MHTKRRTIAIIPAKSNSRRVPNKNMRLLNGHPLLYYTIKCALKSKLLDEIVISTDSAQIQEYAQQLGVSAPFLRDMELCGPEVHSSMPVADAIRRLGGTESFTHCVVLMPTYPFRKCNSIDKIIERSFRLDSNVISVTSFGKTLQHFRYLNENGTVSNVTDRIDNFQTQDFPLLYYVNGVAYCCPVKEFLKYVSFHYGVPNAYVMGQLESFDIDTEDDLAYAEKLLSKGLVDWVNY